MIVAWFCFCISEKKRKLMLLKTELTTPVTAPANSQPKLQVSARLLCNTTADVCLWHSKHRSEKKGLTRHLPVMYLVYLAYKLLQTSSMAHLHKKGEWNAKSTVWCRYFQDSTAVPHFRYVHSKRFQTSAPGTLATYPTHHCPQISSLHIIAIRSNIVGTWDHHCHLSVAP